MAAGGGVLLWSIAWDDDCTPRCTHDQADGLRLRAYVGYSLLGAGTLAAFGGGLIWLSAPSRASGVRAWIAPAPAGLVMGGQF